MSSLVKIHLTKNISYYDKVIFWTHNFGEGKNNLKGFENKRSRNRKYGIAYCKKLKKRSFLKNEKWQIENSETSEISEISEILFRVFLFPSFRFCPIAKIENSDLKISEKNFRVFRDFLVFRVFDLAYLLICSLLKSHLRIYIETWNLSFCFQPYFFILKSVIDKVLL